MNGQLANYKPDPFYPRIRTPVTIEDGGWMGRRHNFDVLGKEISFAFARIGKPDGPVRSLVAVQSLLSHLQ